MQTPQQGNKFQVINKTFIQILDISLGSMKCMKSKNVTMFDIDTDHFCCQTVPIGWGPPQDSVGKTDLKCKNIKFPNWGFHFYATLLLILHSPQLDQAFKICIKLHLYSYESLRGLKLLFFKSFNSGNFSLITKVISLFLF